VKFKFFLLVKIFYYYSKMSSKSNKASSKNSFQHDEQIDDECLASKAKNLKTLTPSGEKIDSIAEVVDGGRMDPLNDDQTPLSNTNCRARLEAEKIKE
jgi:hypothetical protein